MNFGIDAKLGAAVIDSDTSGMSAAAAVVGIIEWRRAQS